MRRDWSAARAKCDQQGCRICGLPAEAAHTIGRVHDKQHAVAVQNDGRRIGVLWVHPDRIVPLCGPTPGGHHGQYDRGELDLLPHLTLPEQLQAVADAGSIELARKRLVGHVDTRTAQQMDRDYEADMQAARDGFNPNR